MKSGLSFSERRWFHRPGLITQHAPDRDNAAFIRKPRACLVESEAGYAVTLGG